jgi:uncharacterized protein YecE (DUF72 family)
VTRIRVGTSGFAYKEWKGTFYPEDLPADGMLRFYAAELETVEINNTFYRMPSPRVLAAWAADVPEPFRFVLKAPQRITHRKRLVDAGEELATFLKVSATLGEKRGPLLFQLPPYLRKDVPRLTDFLALLPGDTRAAFEFRHATWHDDQVYEALRSRGAALCIAEEDERSTPPVATARWGYLRLRKQAYAEGELAAWAERIQTQGWDEAWVFFKHEEEGAGPRLARVLVGLLGGR